MTEDVIEKYKTFNTNGFPEDLIFGDFNNQPIPSTYSDLINDYNDDGAPIDDSLADNELLENAVVPNDKDTNDKITTEDDDILASDIDPTPNKIL